MKCFEQIYEQPKNENIITFEKWNDLVNVNRYYYKENCKYHEIHEKELAM